jgi:hypothetical protein
LTSPTPYPCEHVHCDAVRRDEQTVMATAHTQTERQTAHAQLSVWHRVAAGAAPLPQTMHVCSWSGSFWTAPTLRSSGSQRTRCDFDRTTPASRAPRAPGTARRTRCSSARGSRSGAARSDHGGPRAQRGCPFPARSSWARSGLGSCGMTGCLPASVASQYFLTRTDVT